MRKEANLVFDSSEIKNLENILSLLITYGKIILVTGVIYPEGSHEDAIKSGETFLNQIIRPKLHKIGQL